MPVVSDMSAAPVMVSVDPAAAAAPTQQTIHTVDVMDPQLQPTPQPMPQPQVQQSYSTNLGTSRMQSHMFNTSRRNMQPAPLLSLNNPGTMNPRASNRSVLSRNSVSSPVTEPIPQSFAPIQPVAAPVTEPIPQSFAPIQPVAVPVTEPIPQSFAPIQPVAAPVAEPIPQSFAPIQPVAEPVPQSFAPIQPVAAPVAEPVPQSFAPQNANSVPTCMVIDDADYSLTYGIDANDNSYPPVASVAPIEAADNQRNILSPNVVHDNDTSSSHNLNGLERTDVGMMGVINNLPSVPTDMPSVVNEGALEYE